MNLRMSQSKHTLTPPLQDEVYQKFFYQTPERRAVFTARKPYIFVAVTDQHLEMVGLKRQQVIGRGYFDVFPDTSQSFLETGKSVLEQTFRKVVSSRDSVSQTVRFDTLGTDGKPQERYWKVTNCPIVDSAGKVAFVEQITRNVTPEMTADRDFKELREQLQDALEIGKIGSWVWDVERDVLVSDGIMAGMFGVNKEKAARGVRVKDFLNSIHKDDVARVRHAVNQAVKSEGGFEEEYRTTDSQGFSRWILARGKAERTGGRLMFPGVIVDITERRNLQAEIALARQQDQLNRQAAKILQKRNDELEEINRTKDEFVALASHQLRTPATAVKQYLGMVLQGYVGDITDLQTEMLDKAFESNERQIQIINHILNAARVDTGRLAMTTSPLDIRTIIEGVATDMTSVFVARHHTFSMNLPKRPVMVQADHSYLRMVFENLLGNACVYTPSGGQISLKLTSDATTCHIAITDNGVGIRKADLGRLFSKFSRIHNPLSVQAGGTGIGLYLAAEIARLHGGSIAVESRIRHGTTFTVTLPLAPKELPGKQAV